MYTEILYDPECLGTSVTRQDVLPNNYGVPVQKTETVLGPYEVEEFLIY